MSEDEPIVVHKFISHAVMYVSLSDWPNEVKRQAMVMLHECLLLTAPPPIQPQVHGTVGNTLE
jgi:hypothetical protein